MEKLASFGVPGGGQIELCLGDLAALSDKDEVEIAVVSAFPDDYTPTRGSVIGALHHRGLDVAELADHKWIDLRVTTSCWLSQQIDPKLAGFRYLLCFEPPEPATAAEAVGDVFRALIACLPRSAGSVRVVMPILATGDMGRSVGEMLPSILDAGHHWMERTSQLSAVTLVVDDEAVREADRIFQEWGADHRTPTLLEETVTKQYDFFVSYSWEDGSEAMQLVFDTIKALKQEANVFVDRLELDPGVSWQQKIAESLENSRKIILLLTPGFLRSKSCTEEWNMATLLHKRSVRPVLFPLFTLGDVLPLYMEIHQYVDCRQGDPDKLREACRVLVRDGFQ